MRVLYIHLMCDILFKANSLTSYESTVCFNHLTIDWINGTRTNKPYHSDHIQLFNLYYYYKSQL